MGVCKKLRPGTGGVVGGKPFVLPPTSRQIGRLGKEKCTKYNNLDMLHKQLMDID